MKTCGYCGGLQGEHMGEMIAGTPCRCGQTYSMPTMNPQPTNPTPPTNASQSIEPKMQATPTITEMELVATIRETDERSPAHVLAAFQAAKLIATHRTSAVEAARVEHEDKARLDWLQQMADDCEGQLLTRCFIPDGKPMREKIDALMKLNSR